MATQRVDTTDSAHQIGSALTQGTNTGTIDLGVIRQNFVLQIHYTGTPTAPSIQLQGSLNNGANWYNLGAAYTATADGVVTVTNTPAQYVRATVGGTTVTASLWLGAA